MAEHDQQFDSFQQWVNKASSWLTRHADYSDNPMSPFRAICFDAQGRLCRTGRDFMRARDSDAFPIRWVWPDQMAVYMAEIPSKEWPPTFELGPGQHYAEYQE